LDTHLVVTASIFGHSGLDEITETPYMGLRPDGPLECSPGRDGFAVPPWVRVENEKKWVRGRPKASPSPLSRWG
jgi:hypothetical protein